MTEGSVSYEATFSLDYDPGIFFVPGAGAKIAQPNVDSIFTLAGAMEQATGLLEQAKSMVSTGTGGNLSFDASAVVDFATNVLVQKAQEALESGIPDQVSSALGVLSSFDPQQLASITAFNFIAASIKSPQDLISQVSGLKGQSLGSLASATASALAPTISSAVGGAVAGAVGGAIGGVAGSLASSVATSLVGSLGKSASTLAGGKLPSAETWSSVFGDSFDPSLAPFLNLSLGQLTPPVEQALEIDVDGTVFGAPINIEGVDVPVLGEISI